MGMKGWLAVAAAAGILSFATAGFGQTPEGKLRSEVIAGTLQKFNADLQRNGNGSYEAWVAKLAPLREYWANRALHRDRMWLEDFESPEHYIAIGIKEVLGDPTMRMDTSQPINQIVRLNYQLKTKGIDLIFAIAPTSLEVFPEKFVDRPELVPEDGIVTPYRRKFLHLLTEAGVEVVDLVDVLRSAKSRADADQLTLKRDFHLSNLGIVLSAEAIARRLKRYEFVAAAQATADKYKATEMTIEGLGQTLKVFPVRMPDGKSFEAAETSPILCIGDSNMQIYGTHNPVRSWLPNGPDHADFTAQLSRFTGVQSSLFSIQAFTPDMLNREPVTLWKDRKVVVWITGSNVISNLPWSDVHLQPAGNPKLVAPNPGTLISEANAAAFTVSWTALPEVEDYWLDVGTGPASGDIFGGFTGKATSKTIDLTNHLNGRPIFVGIYPKFWGYLLSPGLRFQLETQAPKK